MPVTKNVTTEICVVHVDDDKMIAKVTGEYLTREDNRITYHTAQTAQQGVEIFNEHCCDCVISDYDMPRENGISFLKQVREIDPEVPFILYTGKGSEEVASEAFSAGASDYFQKKTHIEHYTVLANRVTTLVEKKRAQQRQEEHLMAIESAADAIAIIDADGIVNFANPAMAEMYDTNQESLVGTHVAELYAETAADRVRTDVLPTVMSDGVWKGHIQAESSSRGTFEVKCTVSRATGGKTVLNMSDVSEHKESRRELTRYEAIVDALGDPVYVLDETGEFLYVNNSFVETFGYPAETVVGSSVEILKDETAVMQGRDNLRQVLSSSGPDSVYFETEIKSATKETIPCMDNMTAIFDDEGEFVGSAGVLRDISAQKQRERKLKRQNDRLEQFASTLAHDIRNPLSAAMAKLQLARDETDSTHLESVSESLSEMESMITQLLELAQTDETKMTAIDLAAAARNAWRQINSGDNTLSIETAQSVTADRAQLQRLLQNLFSNSIRHSDEAVTVSVRTTSNGFYVDDTGPGIPVAERDTVRETGYTTHPNGSGCGFEVVENIVINHGWEMHLSESPSGGLRVEIANVSFPSASDTASSSSGHSTNTPETQTSN